MARRPSNPASRLSRRTFLTTAAALAGAASGRARVRWFASRRLNGRSHRPIGSRSPCVGAGGRGADNIGTPLRPARSIVALCDCDEQNAAESFAKYPDARSTRDWRRMLDAEKTIDAVLVATPDHNHAIVSVAAMQLGKHVYCEKPLAHSIWEVRADGAGRRARRAWRRRWARRATPSKAPGARSR